MDKSDLVNCPDFLQAIDDLDSSEVIDLRIKHRPMSSGAHLVSQTNERQKRMKTLQKYSKQLLGNGDLPGALGFDPNQSPTLHFEK